MVLFDNILRDTMVLVVTSPRLNHGFVLSTDVVWVIWVKTMGFLDI